MEALRAVREIFALGLAWTSWSISHSLAEACLVCDSVRAPLGEPYGCRSLRPALGTSSQMCAKVGGDNQRFQLSRLLEWSATILISSDGLLQRFSACLLSFESPPEGVLQHLPAEAGKNTPYLLPSRVRWCLRYHWSAIMLPCGPHLTHSIAHLHVYSHSEI